MTKLSQQWKIVKIIDDYTVVINGGKNDDLANDDELIIFSPGEKVIDPDTGLSLGTLDSIKANIYIENALDLMSVCKSSELVTTIEPLVKFENPFSSKEVEKLMPLNVDPKQITGGLNTSKIVIGDLVRKL